MKITTKQLTAQEMIDTNISSYVYINPAFLSAGITLVIMAGFIMLNGSSATAERIKCSVFRNQSDAQAHYQKSLDRNHDGIACNSLK